MARHARRQRRPPPAEITADIVDLAQDGRGVARVDGKVVFVAGALPGERVRLRLTRVTRDADSGVATAVEQPSADRVVPRCAHFDQCGGCAMQHLAPDAQLRIKQKQLLDAFERIGQVKPEAIASPVTGPIWNYRRRARLGVRWLRKEGCILVGFRERDRPGLARLARCEVLDARVGDRLQALAEMIARLSIRELLPQIEVASSSDTVALVLRTLQSPTAADRAELAAFAEREGLCFFIQSGGPHTLVPLLPPAPTLHYAPDGGSLRAEFTPLDFVQVNEVVARAMVRQALDWLQPRPDEAVLELFSGIGHFSLPLAATGVRLTAVEGDADLVARGRANAERNGLAIRYLQADLLEPDARASWLQERFDAVLLDPPRAGAREVLPLVTSCKPKRIVYVSCHPGTLARDAVILVREQGYRLTRAGVLDMFPHTAHVESMALFQR